MGRTASAQQNRVRDSVADDHRVERRPYVILGGGFGAQAPAARGGQTYGGVQLATGLGYPVTRRLAVRGEYRRQWFFRGSEAVAPCVYGPACPSAPRVMDYQATELLLEGRTGSAAEARALAFGVVGTGMAWTAERATGDGSHATPVAVLGLGTGRRSARRSERGVRLEARYTVFGREALGTRGLVSLAAALWI